MKEDQVNLRSEESLAALLPSIFTDMSYADVKIITADGYKFLAHSCVLSSSPLLKNCLRLVDVRVSPDIIIHIEFNHHIVLALINFLYKGTARMGKNLKQEFTKLCKTLRLNPPVLTETSELLLVEDSKSSKTSDYTECDGAFVSENTKKNEPSDSSPRIETRSAQLVEDTSKGNIGCEERNATITNVCLSQELTVEDQKDKVDKENNEIPNPASEEEKRKVPEEEANFYCEICKKRFATVAAIDQHKEVYHSTCNIVVGENDISYEESTESISDFLTELNKKHESFNLEMQQKEVRKDNNSNESESFNECNKSEGQDLNVTADLDSIPFGVEFKMPENFDIPPDYIQEIVPKKSSHIQPEERIVKFATPENPTSPPTFIPNTLGDHKTDKKNVKKACVEQLTYFSKETSSKSTKSTKRHLSGDLKRNRKRQSYVAELFGECSQESEGQASETPKHRKEFESFSMLSEIPKESPGVSAETNAVDSELLEELQGKKERIKKRLQDSETDNDDPVNCRDKKKKRKKLKTKSGSSSSHSKSEIANKTSPKSSSSNPDKLQGFGQSVQYSKSNSGKQSTSSQPKQVKAVDAKSKAPFKFADDLDWLVPDSYEDSPSSDTERQRKEKKRKKKKKHDRKDEPVVESSEEDDRRKRLDERKQKSGGDVLAWMFKRPKVSVKYQENGKETIVDKAIYKMILIGDEDEESSGVEEELRLRKREDQNSEKDARSRSSSPHKRKKKKKEKKKKKSERNCSDSEHEREKKKIKRSISVQEEKKLFLPVFNRSVSSSETSSFRIPKISKPKPVGKF